MEFHFGTRQEVHVGILEFPIDCSKEFLNGMLGHGMQSLLVITRFTIPMKP